MAHQIASPRLWKSFGSTARTITPAPIDVTSIAAARYRNTRLVAMARSAPPRKRFSTRPPGGLLGRPSGGLVAVGGTTGPSSPLPATATSSDAYEVAAMTPGDGWSGL